VGVLAGTSKRLRIVVVGAVTVGVLAAAGVTYASTQGFGNNEVGTQYSNGIQVSDDQIINPFGDRLLTQWGKFMGSTVSPDGQFLAATSADKSVSLQIFDLSSYKLIWTVGTASGINERDTNLTVGQEGPTYSPDGKFLWLPQQDAITRFPVNDDGTLGAPTSYTIPKVAGRSALVGQIAYSPDGSTLYAAINGQNTVMAFNPGTGALEQTWNVGIEIVVAAPSVPSALTGNRVMAVCCGSQRTLPSGEYVGPSCPTLPSARVWLTPEAVPTVQMSL